MCSSTASTPFHLTPPRRLDALHRDFGVSTSVSMHPWHLDALQWAPLASCCLETEVSVPLQVIPWCLDTFVCVPPSGALTHDPWGPRRPQARFISVLAPLNVTLILHGGYYNVSQRCYIVGAKVWPKWHAGRGGCLVRCLPRARCHAHTALLLPVQQGAAPRCSNQLHTGRRCASPCGKWCTGHTMMTSRPSPLPQPPALGAPIAFLLPGVFVLEPFKNKWMLSFLV